MRREKGVMRERPKMRLQNDFGVKAKPDKRLKLGLGKAYAQAVENMFSPNPPKGGVPPDGRKER